MNRVEEFKANIEKWIEESADYHIIDRRTIEHPIKKGLMTFNIIFTEHERNLRYTVTGFENEAGESCIHLDSIFLTGMCDEIEENRRYGKYELNIKNIGGNKQGIVKLTRWFHTDEKLDFGECMDILIKDGIDRMI
jgi:hypothetical protein